MNSDNKEKRYLEIPILEEQAAKVLKENNEPSELAKKEIPENTKININKKTPTNSIFQSKLWPKFVYYSDHPITIKTDNKAIEIRGPNEKK